MQFGPLQTDLAASERDLNDLNVARIEEDNLGASFRFALVSDNHDDVDGIVRVAEALSAVPDLAFVVHAGDLTEEGLRDEYRWALEALRTMPVPFVVVAGNHDGLSHGRELFRAMFGPFDWAFRAGPLLFVGFNSNELEFGRGIPDVAAVRALMASDLEAAGVVLVTHQGPESTTSGGGGGTTRAEDELLAEPRVLALLHGHRHAWSEERRAGRPVIGAAAVQADRRFLVVDVDGTALSFARCSLVGCEVQSP